MTIRKQKKNREVINKHPCVSPILFNVSIPVGDRFLPFPEHSQVMLTHSPLLATKPSSQPVQSLAPRPKQELQ